MKHSINRHIVPRETFEAVDDRLADHSKLLKSYIDQLLWWNERVNLVSRSVSRETIWSHIHHSLLLSEFRVYQKARLIVDAGTGGGLPGLPLAITNQEIRFLLNDIVSKKIIAVKQISQKMGLKHVDVQAGSVEKINLREPFVLVSKHAFKVDNLFHMVRHQKWTHLIFYKGLNFENELEGLPSSLQIDVHELFEKNQTDFYKDKAIVILKRVK